ncbi:MAG TPA: Ig-like domain-containing protein [Gammaproteobacteria bacterium]|nr:Ig-like domain-containing protein [Gammaproteobacteria bacterium]
MEPRASDLRHTLACACAGFVAALGLATALLAAPPVSAASTTSPNGTETSPPAGYLRAEQDNAAAAYSGNWTVQPSTSNCSYSGGTATESTASGAQVNFSFTGTAVRWIGYQDSFSGIADVYIDGNFQTSVDTYSLSPVCQSMIFAASGLAGGPHTLTITVTGTHNLASLGTGIWVDAFDYQPQPAVTLTGPAGGATVSGSTTVSADASESGGSIASVQFRLDGANLGTAVTTAPYLVSWNTATASNGSHTLTAVATDSGGNTATAAAVTVTVLNDTSPPTVSITAPANGATVSGSVAVSASASDADGSITGVQFRLDGADLGAKQTASPYSITWDTSTATNGSHTLTAVATDSGGNSSTAGAVTVTVSNGTLSPVVTLTTPANGATVSGTATVSANASESGGSIASVQFRLDGANLGTADTTAPYSVSWNTTTATNGSHTLTAVATDAGGHSTTSSAVTVTVSNTTTGGTPTVSLTTPASGAKVSGTVTVAASASESGSSIADVQFRLDGSNLGSAVTASPYHLSWDTTTASNGSHTLTAVATDAGGHSASATPVTVTVSNGGVDTTPPTVAITSPADGATVSGSVTVYANAADDTSVTSVQFMLDGGKLGAAVTSSPYHVSWDTATVGNGSHSLSAVATDSAGNTAAATPVAVIVANGTDTTTTRLQETDPSISYSAGWIQTTGSFLSGGTANESNATDATATLKFDGVAVTWISYRCACTAGIAEVSVDGGAPTRVDTYAASPEAEAPVFTASGLKQGPHTLKITVTGDSDPAGNSAYVVVDAFDITDDPPAPQGTPPPPSSSGGGGTLGFPFLGLLLAAAVARIRSRRSKA